MNYKLILFFLVLLPSCGSHRYVSTVPVETIVRDTVRMLSMRYDSVFMSKDTYTDRSRDTILVRERTMEHRYRVLRDTLRIVRRDSVPYEVRVTEYRDAPCRHGFASVTLLSLLAIVAVILVWWCLWKCKV